jgi:glycerol-3-phosphate acyltransferase PlsY
VARQIGLGWGLLTLLLDGLKGFLPVFLYALHNPGDENGISLVGLSTLIGHQFSLFQGFRGGKGVSTALGFFAVISPLSCVIVVTLFMFTVYRWRFVSLGSIISACAMPVILALLHKGLTYALFSIVVAGFICVRHLDNFRRLSRGEEPRWGKFGS